MAPLSQFHLYSSASKKEVALVCTQLIPIPIQAQAKKSSNSPTVLFGALVCARSNTHAALKVGAAAAFWPSHQPWPMGGTNWFSRSITLCAQSLSLPPISLSCSLITLRSRKKPIVDKKGGGWGLASWGRATQHGRKGDLTLKAQLIQLN